MTRRSAAEPADIAAILNRMGAHADADAMQAIVYIMPLADAAETDPVALLGETEDGEFRIDFYANAAEMGGEGNAVPSLHETYVNAAGMDSPDEVAAWAYRIAAGTGWAPVKATLGDAAWRAWEAIKAGNAAIVGAGLRAYAKERAMAERAAWEA